VWWPGLHVELSSRAAYRCYVDRHFLPFFGELAMEDVLPSQVQAWVTTATGNGLSARSVVKYHVVLHGILKQAARDRVIVHNPTADTRLPKIVTSRRRILSPEESNRLLNHIPARWIPLVLTGLRQACDERARPPTPRHVNWLDAIAGSAETATPHDECVRTRLVLGRVGPS
jgi:Phage integrase, N-terminal SAM-like domain